MDSHQDRFSEPWRVEFRRGLELLADGQFAAAEACFERAHGLAPDRSDVNFALGRERMRRGAITEAEALLRAAWSGDPSLASAAAQLARCQGLHQGRFGDAHDVLDAARHQHAQSTVLAVVRAELYLEEGKLEDARREAGAVLEQPGDSLAHDAARAALARVEHHDGVVLARRGELDAALFAWKRASDLDPEWANPLIHMGMAFERLGKVDRARQSYERATQVEPGDPTPLVCLGLLLREAGEIAAARGALERAVASFPDSVEALAGLATLCAEQGEIAEAIAMLSEAAERASDRPAAWVDLGSAWLAAGDRQKAEDCLRIALELDPEHVGASLRLADLLVRDGRYVEAAKLAERAQTLDPVLAEVYLSGRPRLHFGRTR